MDSARLHVFISGKVQGVFFRESTRRYAMEMNVTGWVRNLENGQVEAVFEGTFPALTAMLSFVKQGPKHAEVAGVEEHWEDYTGAFSGFAICK